jgi:hypothetical protein
MIKFPTKKRVDLYKNAVSSEQLQLDLAAAQEFMFDAWETDDLDVVLKLIRKAIKKSPLCADAYSFYCEISEEPLSQKSLLWRRLCMQPVSHWVKIFRNLRAISGDLSKHVHI